MNYLLSRILIYSQNVHQHDVTRIGTAVWTALFFQIIRIFKQQEFLTPRTDDHVDVYCVSMRKRKTD